MSSGRDFVTKTAQEAVVNYLTGLNPSLQVVTDRWFIGDVSADFTTITDSNTSTVYNLVFKGTPSPKSLAYNLGNGSAYVKGQELKPLSCPGTPPNKGFVLGRDDIYYYLRYIGEDTKYYLPTDQDFIDITGALVTNSPSSSSTFNDNGHVQVRISSDANAILLGTVAQNYHTLANGATATTDSSVSLYHQFAHYYIATGFKFIEYKTEVLDGLDSNYLTTNLYPVAKDAGFNIVATKTFLKNIFNLNKMSNGNVPAPSKGENGSQGLWFPHATSHSGFAQFNGLTNFQWHGDSGYVFIETEYAICGYPFSGQKIAIGDQNYTWTASPNYDVYSSYQYILNNDTKGNYVADLIATFVPGYLFSITNSNWTESFSYQYDVTTFGICNCAGETYGFKAQYEEDLNYDFVYTYDVDFIYQLHYFLTPDVWLTTADVKVDTFNPLWFKNMGEHNYSTGAGICLPYEYVGTQTWDAYCFETKAIHDSKTPPGNCFGPTTGAFGAADAQNFAYATTNTTGAAFGGAPPYADEGFGLGGKASFSFYSGISTRGVFDVQGGYSWPGGYFAYFTGPAEFNWSDLNYDQLFFLGPASQYYAVYGGRSSMVVNGLNSLIPQLYGIVTYLMGDGTDFNNLYYGFKGRTPDPSNTNANTAFTYLQNFNGVYRYSSPWLVNGNLSNFQTGVNFSVAPRGGDFYTDAIVQLVDWASLADAYGDSATVSAIDNLISEYRGHTVPNAAQIDSVINMIGAMDPDLIPDASKLHTTLLSISSAIATGSYFEIQPDMIGTFPPDVFTDKIMSLSATFPFQPYVQNSDGSLVLFNRYLKPVDSFMVQEYYIDTVNNLEVIQGFNIDTTGLTTKGKKATGTYKVVKETLLDYVLPLKSTDVKT